MPYYFWTASNLQVASCTDRTKNISASSFPILMNLAASRLQSLSCWTSLSFEKQLESETASIVIPSQSGCFPHCMSCFPFMIMMGLEDYYGKPDGSST